MTLRNFELGLSVPLSDVDECIENLISDHEDYVSDFTVSEVLSLLNNLRSELILMGREQR